MTLEPSPQPEPPARRLRIAIVGLGVAGGIVAAGLRDRDDVDLIVAEKVGADDHANAGNGLNIGPNALVALRRALPAMADALDSVSLPWTRWLAATAQGEELYCVPLDDVAAMPGIRIRWSELYRTVRAPLRDLARFETIVEDITVDRAADPSVAGPVGLTLVETGTGRRERIDGIDLLIAVDGRYSAVRAALCGAPSTRFLGVANFRTLLHCDGSSGVGDMAQFFNGPNRLLAYRLHDDTIYLSGNFPTGPDGEIPAICHTREWLATAFLPDDGPADPVCAWLVDAMMQDIDALHWSRQQEIEMRLVDESGHALFLGDAGHAMAPTLGQGATTAIEDAATLLMALDAARGDGRLTPAAIPDIARAYAETRLPRLDFIRNFSWRESDTLRVGADPKAWQQAKHSPQFRDNLRQLYTPVTAS